MTYVAMTTFSWLVLKQSFGSLTAQGALVKSDWLNSYAVSFLPTIITDAHAQDCLL